MCGIAGFCISNEYRDKLSHDQLNLMMRAGIATNMHRGRDAVGFFTGYSLPTPSPDKMSSVWWKDKGPGVDHLDTIEEELRKRPVPNVLAMHTRAASGTFRPEVNANNHPVLHNDVLAIHNGYIRNHLDIREFEDIRPDTIYKHNDLKPMVDSVAISMLLDIVPQTEVEDHVEDIARYLAMLSGGWASHIMWKGNPSTTLLVAGPSYPLTIQWGHGRLSYASEEGTLKAMWNAAGQPFSKKAYARVMDAGTFMLINNGAPVIYGRYDVERKEYEKILKDNGLLHKPAQDEHIRIVPKTGSRSLIKRYKNKYKEEETATRKLWSSFKATDPSLFLIYQPETGFIVNDETKHIFDALKPGNMTVTNRVIKDGDSIIGQAERPWADALLEADRIFGIARDKRDVHLFGWYGETEVVITDTGSILNIFDWSKDTEIDRVQWEKDDTFDERRIEVLKDYTPLLEKETDPGRFREWFKRNSAEPRRSDKNRIVGKDDTKPAPLALTGTQRGMGGTGELFSPFRARAGTETPMQFPIIVKKDSKEWLQKELGADFLGLATIPFVALRDAFDAEPFEDVEDVDGEVVYHSGTKANIPFMYNELCPVHDQPLNTHKAPHNCDYLMLASLALHQRVMDLNVLEYLYYGEIKLTIGLADCTYATYQNCDHVWICLTSLAMEAYNLWWRIPECETCVECMATRHVSTWPENLTMLKKTFPTFEIVEADVS